VTKPKTKSEQSHTKQKQNQKFCYDFGLFFGELGFILVHLGFLQN
jgi:hypothetical protein